MLFYAAFIIGLAGSFHCIGMCGPIALALPAGFSSRTSLIISRVVYNLGRILTYSLMGLAVGYIGQSIALGGYQQVLSIILGVLIFLAVILPSKFARRFFPTTAYDAFFNRIKNVWGKLFGQNTISSLFIIGFLNGFLPCGLVYLALAGAATSGSTVNGFMYMLLFGAGTFPVMLATSFAGKFVSAKLKSRINKLLPVGGILLAVLLIMRGMSLGIPYISPKIQMDKETGEQTMECCKHKPAATDSTFVDSLSIDSTKIKNVGD